MIHAERKPPQTVIGVGFSLWPIVQTEDRLTICSDTSPKPGSLLVYRKNKILICHRVLYVRSFPYSFYLKGDANFRADGWIFPEDVLGVATHINEEVPSQRQALLFLWHSRIQDKISRIFFNSGIIALFGKLRVILGIRKPLLLPILHFFSSPWVFFRKRTGET